MVPAAPQKPRCRNEPKTVGSAGHSDERVGTIDPVGETSAIARIRWPGAAGNAFALLLRSEIKKRPVHSWRCRRSPPACGRRGGCRSCSPAIVSLEHVGVGRELVEQPGEGREALSGCG
jgi:hypothetical protein